MTRAKGRKGIIVVIGIGLCLVVGLAAPAAAAPLATWTVMAYLDANRDLQPAAQYYLEQLLGAGQQPQLKVLAQVNVSQDDGPGSVAVRYWRNERGTKQREQVHGAGSEKPACLANFVSWAIRQAPAQHYALLIMGHGEALMPLARGQTVPTSGVGLPAAGGILSGEHLAKALTEAGGRTEAGPIDVLFLDCCYGATLEVIWELRDVAHYLVGPPGLMYSPGLPWADILANLQQAPQMTGRDLAEAAVKTGGDFWQNELDLPVALVAIDLHRLDLLMQSLSSFSQAAVSQMPAIAAEITLARSRTMAWGSHSSVADLGGFANVLAEITTDRVLAQQSWQLAQAVRATTVANYIQGADAGGKVKGTGLGIFFPLTLKANRLPPAYTRPMQMTQQSGWGGFLQSYMDQLRQLVTTGGLGVLSES